MKPAKILYFVDDVSPTPEDFEAASKLTAQEDLEAASKMQAQVVFRNARAVPPEGALEECDGVTGKVPPTYAEAYPEADEAIKAHAAKLAKLAKKVGDSPAPKAPAQPAKPTSAPAWTPNAPQ
jgi:hypothetical protein